MEGFVQTIKALLGNDNNARSAAEKQYAELKVQKPQETMSALYQVLAQTQLEQPVREQATVLFRQCLSKIKDDKSVWRQIGEPAQVQLKGQLLALFEAEQVGPVRRKLADCIANLSNQFCENAETEDVSSIPSWPELLPVLMRLISNVGLTAGVRSDTLWIVKEITATAWPVLLENPAQAGQIVQACLNDSAVEVRAAAAQLLCELVDNSINSENGWKPFAPLAQALAGAVAQLAECGKPALLKDTLTAMQLSAEAVGFFKECLASHFLPVLGGIARSGTDEESRRLALEVLISLVEAKPKTLMKIPRVVEETLDLCVLLLLQLGDDVQEWAEQDDDEAEDEELSTYATEVVDRLCASMHKAEAFAGLMAVLQQAVGSLISRGEWKSTVAAITILQQCSEYVEDEATVVQMVAAVQSHLQNAHPRPRYAAWGAIGQFAEDHGEALCSEEWSAKLLPLFVSGLEDPCERVAVRCMEAFQHYGADAVERETMEQFAQPLMDRLGQRLQGSNRARGAAIPSVGVMAATLEDSFVQYFPPLMPLLKSIIGQIIHKPEERELLGKTFECISVLAGAVGAELFKPEAVEIMQAMIQATQVPGLPSDDPVKEYMLAAAERFCSTLKGDFLPFVPHLLPGIFEKLAVKPEEIAQWEDVEDDDELNVAVVQKNGETKILAMSTSALEDLQHALECVRTFVTTLGPQFADFIPQTAQALLPVFELAMTEEVRDLAFDVWGQLLNSARLAGKPALQTELCNEFLKRTLPQLEAKGSDGSVVVDTLTTRAAGVTTCLKKAGPSVLGVEDVRHICAVVARLLGESFDRREAARRKTDQKKNTAKAEEDDDGDEDEVEEEEALCVAFQEVTGALMQHHPDAFFAEGLQTFLPMVQRLIQPACGLEDRKLALYFACDILEHLGEKAVPHWPLFLEHVLGCITHEKADVRTTGCYGAGLAARQAAFAPFVSSIAAQLKDVISQTRARKKTKSGKPAQACADNAISGLGEILMHHPQVVAETQAQLWAVWAAGLPCQVDEQEGVKNHKMLLRLVEQQKPEILGEERRNFPRLMSTFLDLYKTDMVDDETSVGIGRLFLSIGEQQLGQQAAQANLSEKQKKKLLRILREAAKVGC